MTKNNDISYQVPRKYPVALESVAISGSISDFLAELTFELKFYNHEDKNVEILYCFPLPNRAVVTDFEARDNHGSISARPDRINDYDLILEANGAACKLELKEKNLLELALGNVPPDSRVEAKIRMLMPLDLTDKYAILRLPFSLAPRYVPQTYNWTRDPVPSPLWDEAANYSFLLNLDVNMDGIFKIYSPTHKILGKEENGFNRISLALPGSIPDRDLILELRLKNAPAPHCLAGSHPDIPAMAGRLIFAAESDSPPSPEKNPEIILMLDCSASMTPRRFEQALEAVELALRSLAPGDYFNVVTFGGDCRVLSPAPLPYNRKNLNAALEMLANAHPNLEGTELLQILKVVNKLPRKTQSRRNIILISDGEVYNANELIHYVRAQQNNSAIFAVQVGGSSGQSPLPVLSEFSGGFCEILNEESSIAETILRQLSRIIQLPVKNVVLRALDAEIEAPSFMPALFEGDTYSLFFKINSTGANPRVILEGKLRNRKFHIEAPIRHEDSPRIPILRAAAEINALENGDRKSRKAASELAADYNLLAQDTPFLTVHHARLPDLANYYPAFRMVPLVLGAEHRRHYASHRELMAAVHETPTLYGGNFLIKFLGTQEADGTFSGRDLLAEHLDIGADRLEERVNRLLARYFGSADNEKYRGLLFSLLALRYLPENRLTAPARRRVMLAVKSAPDSELLQQAAKAGLE